MFYIKDMMNGSDESLIRIMLYNIIIFHLKLAVNSLLSGTPFSVCNSAHVLESPAFSGISEGKGSYHPGPMVVQVHLC